MFGFARRKDHGEMVKAELGEGLGHFIQATRHATAAIRTTAAPRIKAAQCYAAPAVNRVRNTAANGWESAMTAFASRAAAAIDGARQTDTVTQRARSRDMQNMRAMRMRGMRGMPGMRGMRGIPGMRGKAMRGKAMRWPKLAGLLAVGAAVGTLSAIAKRRRQQQWEEYDPGQAMGPREGIEPMTGDAMRATTSGSATPKSAASMDRMKSTAEDKLSSSATRSMPDR